MTEKEYTRVSFYTDATPEQLLEFAYNDKFHVSYLMQVDETKGEVITFVRNEKAKEVTVSKL